MEKIIDRETFFKRCAETLAGILDVLEKAKVYHLTGEDKERTVLVIVDMVNGFAREGVLSSSRVEALIPEILGIIRACDVVGVLSIAFGDCHPEDSPEFDSYPAHCLSGSPESEMVDEIRERGGYTFIPKNSTNGFLAGGFQKWLSEHPNIDRFIVVGDCTDICILQFAVTLKTYFNQQNKKSRIIVPMNGVDTYDLGLHQADLMNVVSLFQMVGNGVEVVSKIK